MRLNQNINVLMIALWFADEKPNPSFFSVLVSFCNILSSHGITLSSGKHIFLTSTTCVDDALICNRKQYNGEYGNDSCIPPGETSLCYRWNIYNIPLCYASINTNYV